MIQFRTRVFPKTRRLVRINAITDHFLHHLACGGDVRESIEHVMLECPRQEPHRRKFVILAPKFMDLVRQFATSLEHITTLLLGGVLPSLHGGSHFTRSWRFCRLWHQALPHIVFFTINASHSRNALLREMGLAPSRITGMGRRPDG
jgi:hypothetical protein